MFTFSVKEITNLFIGPSGAPVKCCVLALTLDDKALPLPQGVCQGEGSGGQGAALAVESLWSAALLRGEGREVPRPSAVEGGTFHTCQARG